MLKRLEIENYGSVRHAEVKPTPLHAFVGPNDAGKSTVLKAIEALSRFVALRLQAEQLPPLIPARARETLTLTAEFAGSIGFNVGFAPRAQTLESYIRETMQGEWIGYRHITPDLKWASEEPAELVPFAARIREKLECQVVQLTDAALRADSPLIGPRDPVMFDAEGHALAGVYDRLMARGDGSFEELGKRMRDHFPWIGGFELVTVTQVTKNLVARTMDGQRIPAKQLGSGVLRMLAWEALRYLDRPALLLIEEPEAGLSPALIAATMERLRALTTDPQRPSQVLIATRNPLVVSELGPDEITVVQRNPSEGSLFTPLTNHPDYVARSQALPRGFRWLDLVDGYLGAAASASQIGRL
ncbi:AAA family ATPase [Nannocystaceae bacterium ST9]